MSAPDVTPLGDDALSIRTSEGQAVIEARAEQLRRSGLFEEVVPTLGELTVVFDPLRTSRADAHAALRDAASRSVAASAAEDAPLDLPVRYDGEDLPGVAESLGLSAAALAEAHAAAHYTVLFLGFTPGFAYLGGLPEALRGAERLARPRPRVPAGSVGMVGDRAGVYALSGPGGWPLIGRTQARLFDPGAERPFVLRPGQPVRFVPA